MSSYPSYGGMQSLPCQRCHAPLLPNEATCRNCGYYNAPVQGNNPTAQAPWNTGAAPQPPNGQNQGQYGGNSAWGQYSVPPAAIPANPSSQAPAAFNNPPSMTGSRNFFGAPGVPGAPGAPTAAAPAQAGNGYPSNQAAPPSFAPQRPSGPFATDPIGTQSFAPPPMGPVSSAAYGAPTTGPAVYGGQPMGPMSQAPYGMPPAGFQQYAAPTGSGQLYPGIGAAAQAGAPQSFPMGMAAPSSSADLPGYAQGAAQEKTPARRGPKPWVIVLLVLLVLALVGGGSFFGYTLLKKQDTTSTNQSAPAVNVVKGASLFSDTFKNNANGWSLQSDPGKFSIALANGSLVLEDDSNELLWEPLPGNKTFSDFTLSVDAMLSQGDQTNGYGFYIRGAAVQNTEMATYYRFELYGDGSYAIFKGTVDTNGNPTSAKLVNYTLSSAIQKRGIVNHISITAKGAALSLMVNGQVVKTLIDASYTNGSIAPFVSNMQNAKPGAQAKFSNLTINAA